MIFGACVQTQGMSGAILSCNVVATQVIIVLQKVKLGILRDQRTKRREGTAKKSCETRQVTHTSRYTSGHVILIPNQA